MCGILFSVEIQLTITVFFCWKLLCIMNAISCFIGCVRYHAIPEFFLEWDRACPVMRENCMERFQKLVIVLNVLCVIVTFLNLSFGIYSILTLTSFDHYLFPMEKNDYGSLAMKIFGIVVHFYFSAAWVFPVALSYLVCHVLRNEFKFLGKEIEESTDFKRKSLSTNLENYRWQHIKFTAMVGHANDFLTYHLAASCLVNMVSFSLLLILAQFHQSLRFIVFLLHTINAFVFCSQSQIPLVNTMGTSCLWLYLLRKG